MSLRLSAGVLLLAAGTLTAYAAVFLGNGGGVAVGVLLGVAGLLVMLIDLGKGGSGG